MESVSKIVLIICILINACGNKKLPQEVYDSIITTYRNINDSNNRLSSICSNTEYSMFLDSILVKKNVSGSCMSNYRYLKNIFLICLGGCKVEFCPKLLLVADTMKTQERFDLQYYQKKIQDNCGDLSLPSVCCYVEWDGAQKYVTITEQGYSLSIIRPHSFFRELKLYHKNTVLKTEGTKLFMSSVNVGIWREYNEQGLLINEINEDEKFKFLSIKPLDVLKYIEREGFINLKTGEGQERFDTTNVIDIYFEDKNEPEKNKSKGIPAKWIIKFYNIEMGKVTTHVINAENRDIISITEQFLEE